MAQTLLFIGWKSAVSFASNPESLSVMFCVAKPKQTKITFVPHSIENCNDGNSRLGFIELPRKYLFSFCQSQSQS